MATLYIAEYENMGTASSGEPQIAAEPPLVEQTVTITGTSAQSSAFNANTKYVCITTDAICSVLFGTDPTATAVKKRLPANAFYFCGVKGGDKVAVISNT